MPDQNTEIRTLLAPITGGTAILPGSIVAEVVNFSDPKPYKDAPAWLLGAMSWNDWMIPVVSFAMLAGMTRKEASNAKSRVLVLKSLSGSSSTPYLGILISGVPRLAKVTSGSLSKPKKLAGFPCVFREITIDKEQALIPDLDELVKLIAPELEKK